MVHVYGFVQNASRALTGCRRWCKQESTVKCTWADSGVSGVHVSMLDGLSPTGTESRNTQKMRQDGTLTRSGKSCAISGVRVFRNHYLARALPVFQDSTVDLLCKSLYYSQTVDCAYFDTVHVEDLTTSAKP